MRASISRVLVLQLGATTLGTLLFWAGSGPNAAFSAMVGGLLCFFAGLPYALRVSAVRTASPMQVLWLHGWGELSKIGIAIGVMLVIFVRFEQEIAALPMLCTYILATLSYWVALIRSD